MSSIKKMPFLSKKRKRKVTDEVNGSVNQSISSSVANSSDIEQFRTDNDNNTSRLSNNVLIDISLNQNFNKSQSISQRVVPSVEDMESMDTQTEDQREEQPSNRWADDLNLTQPEPTETQIERDIRDKTEEEKERAKLNVAECGTLESITLINFMCHHHFHLDFGPRINFIVGRNGSGKSAILTAIVLGFGGRASTTSRGKGIASFIKCGETQAKIIIKICNFDQRTNGRQGFNYEDYGKFITIERTLYSSGASTYKIKSAAGKVMAERKEVLEDMIRHFNIQVDNPICVLNQEISRNFLNTKNARDKYTFFMKATLLEDMKNDYSSSETTRSITSKSLEEKRQIIPEMTKDIKRLEQKVRMFNDLENYKEKFEKLNSEAIWALVYETRHKLDAIRAQITKYENKLESEKSKIDSEKGLIEKLEFDKNQLKSRLNNLVEEVQTSHETVEEFRLKCNEIKDEIREKDKQRRNVECELITTKKDIQRLEDKIQELNRQFSDESHNNRKLEISKLRQQIESLKEEETELLQKTQELNELTLRLGEEMVGLRQESNQLSSTIADKSRQMERLSQSRNERLQKFGPKYPELVRRIEEAHKKGVFKQRPLGPIGNHIQLKDYSCALAIELCLKRNIFAFCCDNLEDQKKLKDIIDKLFGNERKPPIITRPFCKRHDVSQHQVQSSEYKSFLELMVIREAPITNCLIDQSRIEQILYIPDYKKAEELLIDRKSSPKNCYQAYTQEGCVMTPSTSNQDYRTYANNTNKRNANYLMKNVDQILEALSEEKKSLQIRYTSIQNEMDSHKRNLDSKHKELRDSEIRKKQIRNEIIRNDTKLKEFEAIGDTPPVEVSTLEEELQTHGAKRTELEEKYQTIKDEKEGLHKLYEEVDQQMAIKKSEYDSLMSERHPIKDKMEKIDTDLKNHGLVLDKYQRLFNETKVLKEEQEGMLAAKEAECKDDENTALQQSGEPIVTKRSSKTVFNEIKQLEKFLDEQENSIGDKDEIYQKYKDLCAHYKRINRETTALDQHLKRLKKSLELRRKGYVELRNFYSMMTKFFFMDVLKCKKFSGSLDIYHKEKEVNGEIKKAKTLEIRVNPKSDEQNSSQSISASISSTYSDTRSLSGGERSYSTVAFILALWESAQSPFKILDEVDVFMDLVTRQISLDAMIEFASQKSGKQYIFLSPLKIQRLPSPELIKIFEMQEPHRNDDQ